MDKLKFVTLENQDGTYSDPIPLNIDSDNVDVNDKTLTEVLGEKVYNFDTIDDVKSNLYLQNGDMISTKGFYSINDGGKANYLIRNKTNEDIEDNNNIIFLDDDNLVAEKIKDDSIWVYGVKGSHSCYIIKFSDGKILVVDSGWRNEWDAINLALEELNITKIDYFIITHFHTDHIYNLQNIIDNYDVSECIFYVMQRPDFENNLSKFLSGEYENYVNGMKILTDNGITPVVPINNSYISINSNYKFHFLNTSLDWFEDYYDVTGEYKEIGKCTLNQFSLYTEVINNESCAVVAFTGDIEKCTEEKLKDYVHKSFILTAPHHLCNRASYGPYWDAVHPKFVVAMNPIEEDHFTAEWYGEFQEVVIKRQIPVISHLSESENGLLTFKVSKYGVTNFNTGDGLPNYTISRIYKNLISIMDWETQREDTVTLENVLYDDMVGGDILTLQIDSTFSTNASQIYSDIQTLCPLVTNDGSWSFKAEKNNAGKVIVTLIRYELKFEFTKYNKLASWHILGTGLIPGTITGQANLITLLKKLGIGHFMVTYKGSGDELDYLDSGNYDLSVDIKYNDRNTDNIRANIEGLLRNTRSVNYNSKISGILDTYENPALQWKTSPYIKNNTTISGASNLITLLKKYKTGIITSVYTGTGDELNVLTDGTYFITCFIESNYIENNEQVLKAFVIGQLKHTDGDTNAKCRSFSGYINTQSTPEYLWLQTNWKDET